MSRSTEIELAFGGEDRLFRLRIGQLRPLQEKTDAGPMELIRRIASDAWRVDDLRETIYQGLRGGGMHDAEATKLIKIHFDDQPIAQYTTLASNILMAAVIGAEDEPLGEPEGETAGTPPSPEESSASPISTAPPPPSVTIRGKSTT